MIGQHTVLRRSRPCALRPRNLRSGLSSDVRTIASQAFEFLTDSEEENVKTVTSNLVLVTDKMCSVFIALMRNHSSGTGDSDSDLERVPLAPPLPPHSREPWHFSMPFPLRPSLSDSHHRLVIHMYA